MEKKPQNYDNHARFDPPFHFFVVPIALITTIAIVVRAVQAPSLWSVWLVVVAVAGCLAVLKVRLNALRVQDRVIRLEERLRKRLYRTRAPTPFPSALWSARVR